LELTETELEIKSLLVSLQARFDQLSVQVAKVSALDNQCRRLEQEATKYVEDLLEIRKAAGDGFPAHMRLAERVAQLREERDNARRKAVSGVSV